MPFRKAEVLPQRMLSQLEVDGEKKQNKTKPEGQRTTDMWPQRVNVQTVATEHFNYESSMKRQPSNSMKAKRHG